MNEPIQIIYPKAAETAAPEPAPLAPGQCYKDAKGKIHILLTPFDYGDRWTCAGAFAITMGYTPFVPCAVTEAEIRRMQRVGAIEG